MCTLHSSTANHMLIYKMAASLQGYFMYVTVLCLPSHMTLTLVVVGGSLWTQFGLGPFGTGAGKAGPPPSGLPRPW